MMQYDIRLAALQKQFRLDDRSIIRLRNSAHAVQSLEERWKSKLNLFYQAIEPQVVESLVRTGKVPEIDWLGLLLEHSFESMWLGVQMAETNETNTELPHQSKIRRRLAGKRAPRTLGALMEIWDKWRKKKEVPKRQRVLAERIRRDYMRKVQDVWEKHSEEFRRGDIGTQKAVVERIYKQSKATMPRARMLVETETTHHYNQARRSIYDQSPDVTHYLFVPIRDAATTQWCNTRRGVVYTKGTAILDLETPPIHWNCRSEVLPLTPKNPRHLVLINNRGLRRENRKPFPLHPQWTKRVA